jgi:hypothetical protein
LGKGVNVIFLKGASSVSIYSAIIALFLFTPFLKTYKNFKSVGITSILLAGVFLVWSALVYAVIFPYPVSKEKFLPVYELARLFFLGRFFQRVESIFVFIWASSAMLYISTGFYQILYVFQKMFKLEYFRPLIIPFAILIFNLSLLPESVIAAFKLESDIIRNYAWIVSFAVPFIVVVIASIRKKNSKGGKCIEKN